MAAPRPPLTCPGCGRSLRSVAPVAFCHTCGDYVDRVGITPEPDPPRIPDDGRDEAAVQAAIRRVIDAHPDLGVWDTSQPFAAAITPGLPDIIIIRRGWGVLFVEVKRATGTLSDAQRAFRDACRGAGVPWACWRSEHDAVRWIEHAPLAQSDPNAENGSVNTINTMEDR